MRVVIEKKHLECYSRIAKEVNIEAKRHTEDGKKVEYEKLIEQKNISMENKKKRLAKALHKVIIKTFSLDISKIRDKKREIDKLKENADIIRKVIQKLADINNYIEESMLRELGIIKKSLITEAVKDPRPIQYLEKKRVISKSYISKIEHTVYELIQRIIFFDRELLKSYRRKKVKVVSNEKLEIKSLDRILMSQTELLEALEAKIPPPSNVKAKLLSKGIFNQWVPMVFALLSGFETEYWKEKEIFSILKKDSKLRKKIEKKIKYIISEKDKMLKIKEKRAILMSRFKNISDEHRQAFHEYISAASL